VTRSDKRWQLRRTSRHIRVEAKNVLFGGCCGKEVTSGGVWVATREGVAMAQAFSKDSVEYCGSELIR